MAAENPIDFAKYIGGEEALKTAARSVRSLKTDVAALSKSVDDDAGRIQAGFARIAEAVKAVQDKSAKLNLFSPADKKLLDEYTAQIANLSKANAELKATQRAQADIQKGLSDATKQYTSELARQKDELRAAALAGDVGGQKKAAAAIRATTLETTQLSKALRGANSEFTAARGSYDALVIENNKLLASLHALEGGLNSGSQEALKLKKQIFDNTETLKNFDTETNRSFRNVGNYAQSFQGLVAELAKARTAQAGMAQGSMEYQQQQQRIIGFQTAAQKSAANMGLSYEQAENKIAGVTAAIQPLTTSLLRLENEQNQVAQSAGKESEAYRKIGFQIESTKKQIDTVATATATATDKSSGFTEQLGLNREGLKQFAFGLAAGAIGFQAILSGVNAVFQANVVLSDSLADVRKTTGLTADETDRLVGSLKQLDTRTSLAGLLDIAKVAGQLGIAKGDIFEFTKAVDIGVQALGDDFQGGAEQIATELGKISLVFKKELGPDQAQNLLAIGSAVNQIGADGAATAPFLADVALRVGAVSAQTGVGLKNALAYAAVLQETGFTAETSGTALNKLFNTLSTKTTEAFRIARNADPSLTLKEFTRLVNTDFNAAIQVFLKGLNAGGKTTTALAGELSTLKLKGGESQSVIVTLAQNTDLFAQRQATANTQLRDATSLAAEAAIKNDTLGGSVSKLTNGVSNFFTSGAAGRFIKFLVDFARFNYGGLGAAFDDLGDKLTRLGQRMGLVEKPFVDYTQAILKNSAALTRQAQAGQALLDAYAALSANTKRTAAEELELATLRTRLLKTFGTDETAAIQASIDNRNRQVQANKVGLELDLARYNDYVAKAQKLSADAQQALTDTQVKSSLTAEQVARARQIAQARINQPGDAGAKSANPALEPAIAAATRLARAEAGLADAQRTRANILAALAKLQPAVTKASQDAADAAGEEDTAEETLDRAAKARSDRRRARLQGELADNQRRIDELKKYQAEQGKLFEEKQITPEVFAARVAGSQDAIIQLERDGTALRLRIAREETAGKLVEIENERVRSSAKKKISAAELADIQAAANEKALAAMQELERKVADIRRDGQKRLEQEPINFIAPQDTKSLKAELDKAGKLEQSGIAQSEARIKAQGERNKIQYDKDVKAKEDAEKRKQRAQQLTFDLIANGLGAVLQIQGNNLRAQADAENASYNRQIKNAGDNADLKARIEEEHQKKAAVLQRKQAENERKQALFSIAISTAQAIAAEIRQFGFLLALPFIAADVALGAIQATVVASQPIPQFFRGRRGGAPVPIASVAERGPEVVHHKATNKFVYHAKPTITSLGKDDDVFTAEETRRMMASAAGDMRALQQPLSLGTSLAAATAAIQQGRGDASAVAAKELAGVSAKLDKAVAALQNQAHVRVNVTDEGIRKALAQGQSLSTTMNSRLDSLLRR